MRTKQLFLILALLCTMVQGAWAQASWEEVLTSAMRHPARTCDN